MKTSEIVVKNNGDGTYFTALSRSLSARSLKSKRAQAGRGTADSYVAIREARRSQPSEKHHLRDFSSEFIRRHRYG